MEDGSYVEASKATLGEYLAEWLDGLAVQGLRNSTRLSYDINLRTLVLPRIGAVPLQKLTPATLTALYSELLERGRKNGGPLSLRTVRYVHTIVKKALRDAVDAGLLMRNPADRAKPPSARAARSNAMRTWTSEQLASFLHHVRGERLYAAFLLGASTGLRRGELLGLRWRDLDLEARQLSVRQTLIAPHNRLEFSEPKTERGRRQVELDVATVDALREHRKRQLAERLAFGPGYEDEHDLVFREADGRPVHPSTFSSAFLAQTKRAGLPRIRLHDLRHTHVTLLRRIGVPVEVVSKRVGHSSPSITSDIYSHVGEDPALQREAAERVAALILAPARTPGKTD
ncbi:MAG: tyrosine-type recombinase/integrase [Gaiellaceae bacterium]